MNLISVIIPVFNSANYLSATLESLLTQTYQQWEAILVDDGSTDASLQIAEEYSQQDARIHSYDRERNPKGGSVCRNIGLEKARGKYVIFLDSDDLLAPWCLQQRVTAMEKSPSVDYMIFGMEEFFEQPGDAQQLFNREIKDDPLYMFLKHEIPWTITGPIWKRSLLLELGGFNEAYPRLQDPELHSRLLLRKSFSSKNFSGAVDCYYRKSREYKVPSRAQAQRILQGTILYISDMMTVLPTCPQVDMRLAGQSLRQLLAFVAIQKGIHANSFRLPEFRQLWYTAIKFKLVRPFERWMLKPSVLLLCNSKFPVKGGGRMMSFIITTLIK